MDCWPWDDQRVPPGRRALVGVPFGAVVDVVVEAPDGRRTLYVPTPALADFIAVSCVFDKVRLEAVTVCRVAGGWEVQAGPLRLSLVPGPAWCAGGAAAACRARVADADAGGGRPCSTCPPASCCPGCARAAASGRGRRRGMAHATCIRCRRVGEARRRGPGCPVGC